MIHTFIHYFRMNWNLQRQKKSRSLTFFDVNNKIQSDNKVHELNAVHDINEQFWWSKSKSRPLIVLWLHSFALFSIHRPFTMWFKTITIIYCPFWRYFHRTDNRPFGDRSMYWKYRCYIIKITSLNSWIKMFYEIWPWIFDIFLWLWTVFRFLLHEGESIVLLWYLCLYFFSHASWFHLFEMPTTCMRIHLKRFSLEFCCSSISSTTFSPYFYFVKIYPIVNLLSIRNNVWKNERSEWTTNVAYTNNGSDFESKNQQQSYEHQKTIAATAAAVAAALKTTEWEIIVRAEMSTSSDYLQFCMYDGNESTCG